MSPAGEDRLPTEEVEEYWLHAYADGPSQPTGPTPGKWLVFVPVRYVDKYWQIVQQAVRRGALGPAAKVATSRPNPHEVDPTRRPIIVYTRDWHDEDDVRRVLRELRALGISWRLTYKTDEATTSGTYGRGSGTYVSASGSGDFAYRQAS